MRDHPGRHGTQASWELGCRCDDCQLAHVDYQAIYSPSRDCSPQPGGNPHPPPGPWALEAACLGMPPDLFFPDRGGGDEGRPAKAAKRICYGCKVRWECLAYGLGETHGIWGGYAPRERRAMRRRRAERRKEAA